MSVREKTSDLNEAVEGCWGTLRLRTARSGKDNSADPELGQGAGEAVRNDEGAVPKDEGERTREEHPVLSLS